MKILMTGATGFLGSHVARRLLERDDVALRALHRPSSSFDLVGDIRGRIEWVEGDVTRPDTLYTASDGIDCVVHCAANLGFGGKKSRERLHTVNVTGTANLVNAALASGVGRFVHTSSIAALGRAPGRTDCLDETAEWVESDLNSEYGRSKYLAELEVRRGIAEGLEGVMVNPSLIMGPGRSGENTTQLVEQVRAGKLPFAPPGATNTVDVLDVAEGIGRALERGRSGERYILSGENLTWRELVDTLADALGVDPPKRTISPTLLKLFAVISEFGAALTRSRALITRETARLSSSFSCYDNSKAVRELGCSFRPFSATAERIAASFD